MAKVKITGHASGTGVVTITAPNTSTDRTITLPDGTGTLLDENSSLPAANLTGTVADARITSLAASKLTGDLPAISGVNVTNVHAVNSGRKNLIINGGMQVSQRIGTTAATITDGSYGLDRWNAYASGPVKTTQQVTESPAGLAHSMKFVNTSASASPSYNFFRYLFEGNNVSHLNYGSSVAQTTTVSFWVRSSVTGVYSLAYTNSAGNASYPQTYSINSADTWEYKTITVAGATSGTWLTGSSLGLDIRFNLGSGSGRTSTAGVWGTTNIDGADGSTGAEAWSNTLNATFYITGVQLELGSVATNFEHLSYGEELALCQRYYYKVLGLMSSQSTRWLSGYQHITLWHPVIMRANPTFSDSGGSSYMLFAEGATDTPSGQAVVQVSSKEVSEIYLPSSHAQKGTFVRFVSTSKFYEFSAEL